MKPLCSFFFTLIPDLPSAMSDHKRSLFPSTFTFMQCSFSSTFRCSLPSLCKHASAPTCATAKVFTVNHYSMQLRVAYERAWERNVCTSKGKRQLRVQKIKLDCNTDLFLESYSKSVVYHIPLSLCKVEREVRQGDKMPRRARQDMTHTWPPPLVSLCTFHPHTESLFPARTRAGRDMQCSPLMILLDDIQPPIFPFFTNDILALYTK